ncbi:hypothetical protein [Duganella aceris]|uniref:Uncharacterized protein n=1 Tax=Duganella aceris TaxID=2703883 RepID=A0ABX0FK27_9BURK|nr:hypothetical protein [Duganella aceris]NGZ84921.1 hypothetical protein [Duganella aceris]
MKNVFALTVLLLISSVASAMGEVECVSAKVAIALAPSSSGAPGFEAILTVSRDEKVTTLRYDMNIDFIGVECRKNHLGRTFIVFQAYCGGSGCKDLDNFGIIDPTDLRVLLVPNDWNRADAARIFGGPVGAVDNVISLDDIRGAHAFWLNR